MTIWNVGWPFKAVGTKFLTLSYIKYARHIRYRHTYSKSKWSVSRHIPKGSSTRIMYLVFGQNSQPYEVNIMRDCVSFQVKVQILAIKEHLCLIFIQSYSFLFQAVGVNGRACTHTTITTTSYNNNNYNYVLYAKDKIPSETTQQNSSKIKAHFS